MNITQKVAILGVAAIALAGLTGCQNFIQNEPVTCTVTDKDRSTSSDKDGNSKSVFRVYTDGGEECTTFGLADNILAGNFNASDMYGKVKVGATYSFKTVGTRNGFLSLFPEITSMTEIEKKTEG